MVAWVWPGEDPCQREAKCVALTSCKGHAPAPKPAELPTEKDACCASEEAPPTSAPHTKCAAIACKCVPATASPAIMGPMTVLADELPCELAIWMPVAAHSVSLQPETRPPILL